MVLYAGGTNSIGFHNGFVKLLNRFRFYVTASNLKLNIQLIGTYGGVRLLSLFYLYDGGKV